MKKKEVHNLLHAVVCIIENQDKQILLLRRNFEPYGWCLPGGKVDITKESLEKGILREIEEETGIVAISPKFIKNDVSMSGIPVTVFKGTVGRRKIELSPEHSHYIWVSELLPEFKLAGNTLNFLSEYIFDKENIGLEDKLNFGKYKNTLFTVDTLTKTDPEYILWLNENTKYRFQFNVLSNAKATITQRQKDQHEKEWKEISLKSEQEYRENNLKNAVDTPYGKAINNYDGDHTLIDDRGNSKHETVHWYYGWNRGSWTDDI
jgi:8-oxo-dGTP pyrophosphatase MutT (NUDIX family)